MMLETFLIWSIKFLIVIISAIIMPYSVLYSFTIKKRRVPKITNPLLKMKASELAQMIRERKISSTTVIQAYIERIKTVNPIINCVIQDRFKEALKEGYEADKMIEANPDSTYWARTKPLLGVPMSVKEIIAVKGMSQYGGRLRPRENFAKDDSEAVKNLRNAGAIPIVVTNVPEMSIFWETANYVHGITKNPYNTHRTSGGSSGGEAALLAAGGSVIGIGSDFAGSSRIPSAFCGVFGHKPSSRLISIEGLIPTCIDPDYDKLLVLAPMARSASDLKLILKCAAPHETADLRLEEPVDIKTINVFYMEEYVSPLFGGVDQEVKASVIKAAMYFKKYGIEPKKIVIKDMLRSLKAYNVKMIGLKSAQNVFQRSENVEDWTTWTVIWELIRKLVGFGRVKLYSILLFIYKRPLQFFFPKEKCNQYEKCKDRLIKYFEELLGDNGVLILPVFPASAHRHYQMYSKMFDIIYVIIFNLLEMPATVCPMGLNKNGMPLGLQIAANRLQDRLTIAVAEELENAYYGWVPPSDLEDGQS